MTATESVLYGRQDGIGIVTLNRPGKLNAFAGRMRQELAAVFAHAAEDDDVRVLVITGAGRAFCAGADIDYMQELLEQRDWKAFGDLVEAGRDVVSTIRSVPKPVIASVNGPAAGGGANLALACDIRIAADTASIGQTFNRIGLHPDWGGTYFLPRLVGPAKALELIFSGRMVDAEEALELGLFQRVVPLAELETVTLELAADLTRKPPIAMSLAKAAVYRSDQLTLDLALDRELENQLKCFKSNDAREGLAAFREKRSPNFEGV
jgi:2-(1,2-epoxy-1,2-dihydrophenyl)acetyl-CoA isomerase